MEKSLLLLEQEGTDREQIAQVFRAAHSIKGASACMGFEGLTSLTHELEDLISEVQNSACSVPSAGVSILLQCVDLIAGAVDYVKQKGTEPAMDPSLLENLRGALMRKETAPPGEVSPDSIENEPPMETGNESPAAPCPDEGQELQAAVEEEDEELLAIFLASFQENYSKLHGLLESSEEPDVSENDCKTARDLIEKLKSSARYMDYQPVAAVWEEWEKDLDAQTGGEPGRQKMLERLETCAASIGRLIPQLQVPSATEPESPGASPIEEDDQELYSIFLDSFQQNIFRLAESLPGRTSIGAGPDRAAELTENLIQSSRYMGYTQVVELLEGWNESLSTSKNGGANGSGRLREELLGACRKLQCVLPDLKLPEFPPECPDGSTPVTMHDEADFDLNTDLEAGLALAPEQPPDPSQSVPAEVEKGSVAAPSVKEPVRHSGGKERTGLAAEDTLQSAATLRVDAQKVDQLLNQVGELVVNRSEFIQTATFFRDVVRDLAAQGILSKQELRRLRLLNFRLNESTQSLGRVANDLQASVMRVRMLPIFQLFERFPRIVRDQALKLGKKVELMIEGGDTEIDKRVLEQMNDPLVQFLRNAIAHGIESPEERKRAGKPETGSIRITAYHAGDYVAIEVEDDGQGIDTQKLRELLLHRGSVGKHELERLSDAEVAYSIFMPGISTYDKVDGAAGRGVGLDVVKQNVEHMNGTVQVESTPGRGTRFLIRIPLTVAIIRALLVSEEEQVFTLPLTSVSEILRHRPDDTYSIEGFKVITLRGKTIPLVDLGELLNIQDHRLNGGHKFVVVVSTSFREVGLVVDGLIGEREVVIKSIENGFHPVDGFSGATILGDGRVSLIVDVSALLRMTKDSLAVTRGADGGQYVN